MVHQNDEYLVRRVKQGDESAFTQLVHCYRGKAFGIAFNFVHNVEDAKEISQDAFVKVYRSIQGFNENSSFYTWFYRILINLCLDFKKKRRLNTVSFSQTQKKDEEQDIMSQIRDEKIQHPIESLENQDVNQKIKAAIEELPEKQKIVFILRHYEHFSLKEIASFLDTAQGTVKSHLARACRRLQTLLDSSLNQGNSEEGGVTHG